jgi:2-keto-myo-inositol isomerase
MNRRELFKVAGFTSLSAMIPSLAFSLPENEKSIFRFCLNTATLSGQNLGILKNIETAAKAGYDGIELWVKDVQDYLASGKSITDLKKYIQDSGLKVENAIGFAPCFINDEQQRKSALIQMQAEMELMSELGCTRIAAPPAGLKPDTHLDLFALGQRYKKVIELGRKTGVMPQLEFWGASGTLFQFGQALMVAASANDPDVHILPDVYHIFRGDSGFEGLKMVRGNLIEIFHMNDYPGSIEREKQTDSDRVFPGDGAAPLKQILSDLHNMGGIKVLSLELFNADYWKKDPLWVARTGLIKMKELTEVDV